MLWSLQFFQLAMNAIFVSSHVDSVNTVIMDSILNYSLVNQTLSLRRRLLIGDYKFSPSNMYSEVPIPFWF